MIPLYGLTACILSSLIGTLRSSALVLLSAIQRPHLDHLTSTLVAKIRRVMRTKAYRRGRSRRQEESRKRYHSTVSQNRQRHYDSAQYIRYYISPNLDQSLRGSGVINAQYLSKCPTGVHVIQRPFHQRVLKMNIHRQIQTCSEVIAEQKKYT